MIKPRTYFAKLMDETGAQIEEPTSVIGSVSFDGKTGDAYAWADDGKTMLAEMKCARVVWIEAVGIRLEGHEPVGSDRFRLMQWQVIF